MKRSRYSATMSRCFGSSNQSRDRKRRAGRAEAGLSDAMSHYSLGQAGHIDAGAEETAGQRLLPAFLGAERDVRGGDVKGSQIVAAESRLGHRGAGQAKCLQQLALR